MSTSDERREAAAEFRRAAREQYEFDGENFLDCVGTYLGDAYTDGAAWTRLADLIDPTCTVVSYDVFFGSFGCEEAGYKFKLSCGHTVIVDGDFPPAYCDECGARVVDDD